MMPAEHDMMHCALWLEWPHSIAKSLAFGAALDTVADSEELVAEKSKCAPGAMIKAIARRTLRNRFTLAANMATRYISWGLLLLHDSTANANVMH